MTFKPLIVGLAVLLAYPCMASAQTAMTAIPPQNPTPAPTATGIFPQTSAAPVKQMTFAEGKTVIVGRMKEHVAEVKKSIACSEKATTDEALRACLPHPPQTETPKFGMNGKPPGEQSQGNPFVEHPATPAK